MQARGLGHRTKRGTVFEDVTFDAAAGDIIAFCGPSGSGKSALALALCGRSAFNEGELSFNGRNVTHDAKFLRRQSSISPIPGVAALEDGLQAKEELNRALLLAGKHARFTLDGLISFAVLDAPERTLIRDLSASDINRVAIASAFADDAPLIVIDDLGRGVPLADLGPLWQLARAGAALTGATVLITALEIGPARDHASLALDLRREPASSGLGGAGSTYGGAGSGTDPIVL